MFVVERRKLWNRRNRFDSTEVVASALTEDQSFIDRIKDEIKIYKPYGFSKPDLKEGEILRVDRDIDNKDKLNWFRCSWYLKKEYLDGNYDKPVVTFVSEFDPDVYLDLLLNIDRWKKELAVEE